MRILRILFIIIDTAWATHFYREGNMGWFITFLVLTMLLVSIEIFDTLED